MTIYYFSRTQVTHQFCHSGTAKVEIGQLKKIMWYSSMVNSSTMQTQYSNIPGLSTIL